MTFGKRCSGDYVKKFKNIEKRDTSLFDKKKLIVSIKRIINKTDAGFIDLNRLKQRIGYFDIDDENLIFIIKNNDYIFHKGWIYDSHLWSIDEVNEISDGTITLDNYDIQ